MLSQSGSVKAALIRLERRDGLAKRTRMGWKDAAHNVAHPHKLRTFKDFHDLSVIVEECSQADSFTELPPEAEHFRGGGFR